MKKMRKISALIATLKQPVKMVGQRFYQ